MADHGIIGTKANLSETNSDIGPRSYFRALQVGPQYMVRGSIEGIEGNPEVPSLRMWSVGKFRFRWTVTAGAKTIRVDVKQPINQNPRPRMVVKARPSIGVINDVEGVAAAGTGWVTIGPLTINPTSEGAVWVELEARYEAMEAFTYWDNIIADK